MKPAHRDIIDCAIRVVQRNAAYSSYWTDDIMNCVSNAFGVKVSEIKGSSRKREIAYARFAAAHLLRKYRNYSLPKIGRVINGMDHTSVMYALGRITPLMIENEAFRLALVNAENDFLACEDAFHWPPENELSCE